MNVSINIVTWNDLRYLPDLFRSLEAQTYKDVSIRVLDNGSTDGTLEYIQQNHPQWLVARNVRNLGFAPAHNQLMRFAVERWGETDLSDKGVLMVGADMILHERLLEELVAALQSDQTLGAVQPKLLRAFAEVAPEDGTEQNVQSDVLDTTGFVLTKAWRFRDRGAGELDHGQYDSKLDLVGVTGACALWRAAALKAISINNEPLDGDFFTYREDADLALRARRAGWTARFVPSAKAHHYARVVPSALATRNQLFLLYKNLTLGDWLRSGFRIVPNELARVLYEFIFKSQTRALLLKSLPLWLKMFRKRGQVLGLAKDTAQMIRSYIGA